MGNLRLDFAIYRLVLAVSVVVFPIALVIYLVSSCDLRRRGDKHACRDGSAAPCVAVGKFYEERSDGLVATMLSNATTAKEYYDRACKLGSAPGCARFGHMVVAGSYDTMRDDNFKREDGIAALGKACDLDDVSACNELVEVADPAQAAVVLAKRCDRHDKLSCDKLVVAYQAAGEPKHATALLSRLCDEGDEAQCGQLGTALLATDPARGAELLEKACDRGSASACRELAGAEPARATELLAKACDHRDLDGCFEYGKALIAHDPAKATDVFTAECEHDDRGCDALGDIYRVGVDGIERDRTRARRFYQVACRAGSEFDCRKIKCLDADSDACYRVHRDQRDRRFRLGGAFDM